MGLINKSFYHVIPISLQLLIRFQKQKYSKLAILFIKGTYQIKISQNLIILLKK